MFPEAIKAHPLADQTLKVKVKMKHQTTNGAVRCRQPSEHVGHQRKEGFAAAAAARHRSAPLRIRHFPLAFYRQPTALQYQLSLSSTAERLWPFFSFALGSRPAFLPERTESKEKYICRRRPNFIWPALASFRRLVMAVAHLKEMYQKETRRSAD